MKGITRLIYCVIGLLLTAQLFANELRIGMRLSEALEIMHAEGLPLVYSSDLIEPGMRIGYLPDIGDPVRLVKELLAPWGLTLKPGVDNALLIVRQAKPEQAPVAKPKARTIDSLPAPPEELVVNASRYRFERGNGIDVAGFDAADLQIDPEIGDDPLRLIARLPGATRSDFSARTHIRGGGADENLVLYDGLRLYDPFHLKGFQGLFSSVDARLVDSVDIYMGGYPAQYGDRMSAVTDIRTVQPDDTLYREITASFFNLSGLAAGKSDNQKTDWLVSARRGNLDWVLNVFDPKLGEPRYFEVYSRFSRELTDALSLTANVLVSKDDIRIADSDEEEFASGDYHDEYYWLRLDLQPHTKLDGSLLISQTRLGSFRQGTVDKEGATRGFLQEDNAFRISTVKTDWSWQLATQSRLNFGAEYRSESARYHYQDNAVFALLFTTPGAAISPVRTNLNAREYSGNYISSYVSLWSELSDRLTGEAGIRWSRESLSPDRDQSFDPRLSLLFKLTDRTTTRFSAGRYSQAQTVNELDFADGVMSFAPMQSVTQYILSVEHALDNDYLVRAELFNKKYRNLRPRFENFLDSYTLLPQLWPDRIEIDADRAEARGLELSVNRRPGTNWGWWITYSLASAKDKFTDRSENRGWNQTHELGGGLNWENDRWQLSISGVVRSGWPTTQTQLAALSPTPLISVTNRNGSQFGNYHRLDARIARNFDFSDTHQLSLFLEIYNLTNRGNDCCTLYEYTDESGEFEYATDVQRQVPFFPSLGFIWKF